jgi:hypothetical protein
MTRPRSQRRDKSPSLQRTDYCKDGDLSRLCDLGSCHEKTLSEPYWSRSPLRVGESEIGGFIAFCDRVIKDWYCNCLTSFPIGEINGNRYRIIIVWIGCCTIAQENISSNKSFATPCALNGDNSYRCTIFIDTVSGGAER